MRFQQIAAVLGALRDARDVLRLANREAQRGSVDDLIDLIREARLHVDIAIGNIYEYEVETGGKDD